MAPVFVLDSSALLAFLYGERGREQVQELLLKATLSRVSLRLHRLHLGEVYYVFYRKGGARVAETMLGDVGQLPVVVEDRVSPALMREAGRIKASYRVSYADAFAVGLARIRKGTLVSADRHEFTPVESAEEVAVNWIR
ncbi:MAG: type II toxin-antitoxin system VapC family toxin [Bacillati bacterium ANGP1]|uniref:Type II toxin-antitoxin system VapC family toxin n=1 Tax=Candidatus Segetimicrobium genomatis TaxID=2569760 RepID=A0A537J581_9BACT|nr:MAG: type II toxin-antitoxin system VapC family toxin [Terrabacteria group bacterium ANGP1]